MALVDRIPPEEKEVPHEPGNYFSFRPLTALQCDEAEASGTKRLMDQAQSAKGLEAILQASPEEIATARQRPEAKIANLDKTLLVRYGLIGWRGPDYDGVTCDGAGKDMLRRKTRDWAALMIAEISEISEGEGSGSGNGTGSQSSSLSIEPPKVSEPNGVPS